MTEVKASAARTIDGKGKTVRELLNAKRYSIDFYQREYKWETKQINELVEDLSTKFLRNYEPKHERYAVASYGHYFLGSIIISDKDGQKFIIDGQQRMTSLTLLLIYLSHRLTDKDHRGQIAELIFSQRFGKKAFNLDVEERNECMEALLSGKHFDSNDQPESVINILARYHDIEDQFSQLQDIDEKALPYFVDWLIENVHLVEITAYSDEDAYTIFETMNDRGLSLTPTDMLKGYLLANINEPELRARATRDWKKWVGKLQEVGKEEDADGTKAWLRSQYAQTIRERKGGAVPKDFDLIGTEFHRWVRDHQKDLKLNSGSDFAQFIQQDFAFYAGWYCKVREAAENLTPGLQPIFYNAQNNFTLQYAVLLAPLRIDDPEKGILRKLRVAATYIDILLARRIWNFRAIDYSTMQYAMFLIMKEIRGKTSEEIASIFKDKLGQEEETFSSNINFYLHGTNGRQIHKLLARLTAHVETSSGLPSLYLDYIQRGGKKGYEVEHIWANHADWYKDEFSHPSDFDQYRNRIGGLLLLPKAFNASYGDLPYEKKLEHYNSQNLLARSLNERAYDRNPGFIRYIKTSGLPFQPCPQFKKADLDARQELYRKIAEEIWNPDRLIQQLDDPQ